MYKKLVCMYEKKFWPRNIFDRRNVFIINLSWPGTVYPQQSEFPKEMSRKPLEMSG